MEQHPNNRSESDTSWTVGATILEGWNKSCHGEDFVSSLTVQRCERRRGKKQRLILHPDDSPSWDANRVKSVEGGKECFRRCQKWRVNHKHGQRQRVVV